MLREKRKFYEFISKYGANPKFAVMSKRCSRQRSGVPPLAFSTVPIIQRRMIEQAEIGIDHPPVIQQCHCLDGHRNALGTNS
jgi:hypothetical protein